MSHRGLDLVDPGVDEVVLGDLRDAVAGLDPNGPVARVDLGRAEHGGVDPSAVLVRSPTGEEFLRGAEIVTGDDERRQFGIGHGSWSVRMVQRSTSSGTRRWEWCAKVRGSFQGTGRVATTWAERATARRAIKVRESERAKA